MQTAMVATIIGAILGTGLCIYGVVRLVVWIIDQWANGRGWQ